MTNEQTVIGIESELATLKQCYIDYLTPIVLRIQETGVEPTLEELLKCQQLGSKYFNFVENFVGNSGLLGAHANGKWVTGFAETCHSVLSAYVVHVNFLKSYSNVLKGSLDEPNINAYANMQRMVKEYLLKENWQQLHELFKTNCLPISGFEYTGVTDLQDTPKWQLISGLVVGLFFSVAILVAVIFIPNPTGTQFFVFRGLFSISMAAIAAVIPGLLNVESRYQQFSIKATGAIAVFVIVWLINPPALIGS
ncbi:hypothetical protein NDL37_004522 [Vibrio parahaemolyticus]|nr:hypothetical protein [Vibrio parahaemolyticus]